MPSSQIASQQLISQMIATTTTEQATQEQPQFVTQQPDMTVVEQLATSSSPAQLINAVSSASHAVVSSLQDTSLQDEYVEPADYQV